MLELTQYQPKVALVTGAGKGLGRAITLELVARGMSVAALGRSVEDLDSLVKEAPEGRILPVLADVSHPDDLRRAFKEIDAGLGLVDILINNAAVYPHRDFLEETPESFAQTLDINLNGMAGCAMLALARMVPRGTGRIINLTSFAGRKPAPLSAAYSVSKGAARILTDSIIADVGDRFPDIVINEWIPGALNTGMGLPEGHDPATAAKWGATLALRHDPALMGLTFVEDRQQMPELSVKRRLFNLLSGRTPNMVELSDLT